MRGVCIAISALLAFTGLAAFAQLPTTTQLSAERGGAGTVFTIKVDGGDRGTPSGAVTLTRGESSLGSVLLDQNGEATYNANTSALAEHISAVYQGNGTFQPSKSVALDLPATSGFPTFTVSAAPTTISVKRGDYATLVVTVTPANGFTDPVELSCSSLPANSSCTFLPTTVVPTGTAPVSSTLYIQTLQPSGSGSTSLRGAGSGTLRYAALTPVLALLAGLGLLRKRTSAGLRFLGLMTLLIAGGLGLGACSARYSYFHHPPLPNAGTPLGTVTILLSGASAGAGSSVIPSPVQIVLTVTQ